MSDPHARVRYVRKETMYPVKLDTFGGAQHVIKLPSREAVESFVNEYPKRLPKGIAVHVACDLADIHGTLVGTGEDN